MPSSRRPPQARGKVPVLARWARRVQGVLFWTTLLGSAAYTGYRLAARPYRPVNPRLARFLGRHFLEATGPCLAVTASPLQLERYAGGTLRRLVLAGVPVIVAVVTLSDLPDESFAEQDDEALEAAHRIGYHRIQMLKVATPFEARRVAEQLETVWTDVEPEVVLAFDPLDPVAGPDLAAEQICGEAVLRLAERLDRERQVKLAFCGTRRPNALVDVTPILTDKIQAVLSHRTELALPALAVNLGLRLMSRLPDLRRSYEALRIVDPSRRPLGRETTPEPRTAAPAPPAPPPEAPSREPRRAVVRTRLPVAENPSDCLAADGERADGFRPAWAGARPTDPES